MKDNWVFPFGHRVQRVVQEDRTRKRVFVLGVYASAVHARWIGQDGRQLVRALAVRSEPYIFWRGDSVNELVHSIMVPPVVGKLVPAAAFLNGPSASALDNSILGPMGLNRDDAWLCDLVPHTCLNPGQEKAIRERYQPLAEKHRLPICTVPQVPKELANDARRAEILEELEESCAKVMVLLGDQPIKWFLSAWEPRWKRLSDLGTTAAEYGRLHRVRVAGHEMDALCLAHPRQIARLGQSSLRWFDLHRAWIDSKAKHILEPAGT